MVLNEVDLQTNEKIKKLRTEFPEIGDQEYDEQAKKVTIKVVSDSPEKIVDKLVSKACGCTKSIEIPPPDGPKSSGETSESPPTNDNE